VTLDLNGADVRGAKLSKADLGMPRLREANLREADLREANLGGADLDGANLDGADLRKAILTRANLHEATLRRADLEGVRGAEHAHDLETVRFTSGVCRVDADDLETMRFASIEDTEEPGSAKDAYYFETCYRPWPERWLDWERLRVAGRLPLFGVSYTVLILIPLIFYGLALYNDQIGLVHAWAEQAVTSPDHPLHRLAPLLLERLHPSPLPSQSLLLLISTVLLAVGSTLYTFFSPSRVKEFSRDQWCDQLSRPLLHYWPLAWKHRYIRLVCAACYALGGAGALWVLGTKVWQTALFILEHSTFPWPWR
jgi:Pentapeptide repeats (8 copies)